MGSQNKYHRKCSGGSKNAVANWLKDPQVGNSWHRSRDRGAREKRRKSAYNRRNGDMTRIRINWGLYTRMRELVTYSRLSTQCYKFDVDQWMGLGRDAWINCNR